MEEIGELRALANPLRLRMLGLLARAPMSAAEVSRRLGIAHGSASFHLRQLATAGVVQPLEEQANRGGRERRYSFDPEVVHKLAPRGVGPLETAVVHELRRRLALPRGSGPEMITSAEMWVSKEDWEATLAEVAESIKRLAKKAAPGPGPGLVRGSLTTLLFPLADEEDQD